MRLLLTACCLLGAVAAAGAQTVRGIVLEQETRAPLAGAFVVLVDSAGVRRNATLSDSAGRFYLSAPQRGRFSLRAELIGHESVRSSVVINGSQPSVTLALPIAAVKLAALNVSSTRRCTGRPEGMRETAQIWDEARKALAVTSWAERENTVLFEVRKFERVLHPRTLALMRETVMRTSHVGRPYAAASADSLVQYGFVRKFSADSVLFFGPDADVLLSDGFLDTHCFWVKRGERDKGGLIGLAFEPTQNREVTDVAGTLWVDLRSAELKFIEYRFTRLGHELDVPGVGGRTDFRRMPNGAWIVDRWFIRLPAGIRTARGFVVNALIEGGGEILSAQAAGARASAARTTRITGVVFDSVNGRPLTNATVYLSGTAHRTVTDSTGGFDMPDVHEGHYVIAFSHATFDSLPALPEPRPVSATGSKPVQVELSVPSVSVLLRRTCDNDTTGGVLTGYVRNADGEVVPGESVAITYTTNGRPAEKQAVTDRTGRFVLCALPLNRSLQIRTRDGKAVTTHIGATRFNRRDITASTGAT